MTVCQWPIEYGGCDCAALTSLDGDGSSSPSVKELIEQAATELLWNLTSRRFGVCEVSLRPCAPRVQSRPSTFRGKGPYPQGRALQPVVIDGKWYNMSCGCPSGNCGCSVDTLRSISLPGPVQSVTSVRIDGNVLPDSAYRVDYGNILIRTDGQTWPAVQDMLADPSELSTFEVTYKRGIEVPAGGQFAAGVLACELAKAYCGDQTCELPKRVQTVTRQGVTVGFMDQFEGLEEGKTGIWSIDSWIASVNRVGTFASVMSPDVPATAGRFS